MNMYVCEKCGGVCYSTARQQDKPECPYCNNLVKEIKDIAIQP